MIRREYDVLIVGSGAGGATIARELTRRGKRVGVLERGRRETQVGDIAGAKRYYDATRFARLPVRSKEGVIVYRTFMGGGTTVVACGNAIRCLEKELAAHGIILAAEFDEAEKDLRVAPLAGHLLSQGSERIREAATALGVRMILMPKVIDGDRCTQCGACALGCVAGAKWTALEYLDEAERSGAEILYGVRALEVSSQNGKARGVKTITPEGPVEFLSDTVILAAGGLGTPPILLRSGIENAGTRLFADLFVNTYGLADDISLSNEPQMTLLAADYHDSDGFLLSPFINQPWLVRFIELGPRGPLYSPNRLMGLMTKIADESEGRVNADGSYSKVVTERDSKRLKAGSSLAKDILVKAGVRPGSIRFSRVQSAHPGGTAAVGTVVDRNLETAMKGLYVCDASVLPVGPGKPPILTLVALAKWLAKRLAA
jgi:choline dehydrogenase-like flavoprotein